VILSIRTLGDPVLRTPARPVVEFDRRLARLRDDMIETMYDAPGVGLAGPQVGLSMRMFVFDDGETGPMFMANPELFDASGDTLEDEGCLSIPGPFHPTPRSGAITCRGQGIDGAPYEMTGEGLLARIFQHETDHLDGMLYIDRLDDDGRRAVMAELRRIELEVDEPRKRRLLRRGDD
jgi:peptide deformylase